MIDRKTALICAVLIALMLVLAVWRIIIPDDWTMQAVQDRLPVLPLLLFIFPASSALVVGSLYWANRRARADFARVQPWYRWGRLLSVAYCCGLLLLQGVLVAQSLGLQALLPLSAIGRTLGVLLAIMSLLAVNQMPKLPYFERSSSPGGDLGPIYGPRYIRTVSRIVVMFLIAVFAFRFAAAPALGWRAALIIFLAATLLVVWSVVWRRHLGRKWSLEQTTAHGGRP
jgi:hypothetical protein